MTTCPITTYVTALRGGLPHDYPRPCGQPVDRDGLCAKHADDRKRLNK